MAKYQSTHTGAEIDAGIDLLNSNSATSGQVLTANGTGGASWQDVDDNFVKKITGMAGTRAYIFTPSGDGQMVVTADLVNSSIVARDKNGTLKVSDPEGQNDAVNKAYADARFRYTHLIEVKFNPAPEPYVSYVLIGTIIYASEIPTPLTSIDDLPLDVALPIHGKVQLSPSEFYETYTATRKTWSTGSSYLEVTYMYYSDSEGIATGTPGDIVPTSFTDTVV